MHEYSIVQSLLDSCEEHARKNSATKVIKVEVKIGVLSGVEPQLLQTAFDTFKEETICSEAVFDMQIQPLVLHCNSCNFEFSPKEYKFKCQECESFDVIAIDGEQMYLMRLELQ